MFSLGARLAACAGLVRPQAALADIGTDHAYLPVWLAANGRIKSAVAADVRPGPLERAKENIARCGVGDVVSSRLSDGLDGVEPEEADDIVMAGMGGLLMTRIIGRTPWLQDGDRRLILQPMTSVEDLRLFLSRGGFAVLRESAVREQRHLYTVMLCVYDPPNRATGALFPYVGRIRADTPENRAYLRVRAARLANRIGGLRIEGEYRRAQELSRIRDEIEWMLLHGAEKENGL